MDYAASTIELERGKKTGQRTPVTAFRNGDVLHRDTFNLDAAKERHKFVVSVLGKIPRDDRPAEGEEWDKAAAALDRQLIALADLPAPPKVEAKPPEPDPEELLKGIDPEVVEAAKAMLADPGLFARVCDDVHKVGLIGERRLGATIYMVGTSRKLSRPVSAIVRGETGSGKSYAIDAVSSLFPDSELIRATQMTPQALFHMPPGSLRHKWVVAGERSRMENDDRAEATRALREMQSDGRLSKLMPMKVGGQIETVRIEQEGPIAFVESTTLTDIFAEDANRCLLLGTDESEAQTRRVLEETAKGYAGGRAAEVDHIRQVHHAAQLLLPRCDVVIPFATRVAERFPPTRVDARRTFTHLMGLVKASALLHAFQRGRDGAGNVIAVATDYQIAAELAREPFRQAGGGLSDQAAKFYARLKERFPESEFSTRDARKEGGTASKRSVHNWLGEFSDHGLVEQTEPSRGKKPARWKVCPDGTVSDGLTVPTAQDIFPGCTGAHKPEGESRQGV
jgi:hypothetical protein